MPAEKPLPQNLDAERSVLGAILLDNTALPIARETIHSGDFFLPQNQQIFSTMLALADAATPIDLITVTDALSKSSRLASAGGAAYVATLVDGVPRVGHTAHYCKIVKDAARLRMIAKLADSIQSRALNSRGDNVAELENELRASLRELPAVVSNGNGAALGFGLMDFLKHDFPEPEHLIEGIIPRDSTAMIVALPHRLKSWFTTALALGATRAGKVMGILEVKKPVRTLLVQVEDFPGQVQWRLKELLKTREFDDCDPDLVRIIPRCGLNLPDEDWYQKLLKEVTEFGADLVILDVLRRVFRGDINSPKDTALFLEHIDRLRDATHCTVLLVHHENKKDAEIMTAAAGSYNLPGWANSMIQFKRKTQEGHITHVEIEVDNKLGQSPEPMRMVLDLTSEMPVRCELLEDGVGAIEAEERLGSEWTVRDLAEALEVHKANAHRRLKKWIAAGRAEKISAGKRGRTGGLARYRFVDNEERSQVAPPVTVRRVQ